MAHPRVPARKPKTHFPVVPLAVVKKVIGEGALKPVKNKAYRVSSGGGK